jgi:hypothetical protein
VPRLLGDGIRLFDPWPEGASLKLLAEKAFPSGLVTLTYARDDAPHAP